MIGSRRGGSIDDGKDERRHFVVIALCIWEKKGWSSWWQSAWRCHPEFLLNLVQGGSNATRTYRVLKSTQSSEMRSSSFMAHGRKFILCGPVLPGSMVPCSGRTSLQWCCVLHYGSVKGTVIAFLNILVNHEPAAPHMSACLSCTWKRMKEFHSALLLNYNGVSSVVGWESLGRTLWSSVMPNYCQQ